MQPELDIYKHRCNAERPRVGCPPPPIPEAASHPGRRRRLARGGDSEWGPDAVGAVRDGYSWFLGGRFMTNALTRKIKVGLWSSRPFYCFHEDLPTLSWNCHDGYTECDILFSFDNVFVMSLARLMPI